MTPKEFLKKQIETEHWDKYDWQMHRFSANDVEDMIDRYHTPSKESFLERISGQRLNNISFMFVFTGFLTILYLTGEIIQIIFAFIQSTL